MASGDCHGGKMSNAAPSAKAVRPIRIGFLVRWFFAIILSAIALLPAWWMFNVVFSDAGAALSLGPRLLPTSLQGGFDNITSVLADGPFIRAFVNSIIYSGLTAGLVLVFASAAAYEFAHYDFPGRRLLYIVCLMGLMLPLAVIVIPTQRIVAAFGWLNSIPGVVLPSTASAFALFFLTEYMRAIPRELFEAARLDGATHFGIYWRIAIPLSRNALVTIGILILIIAWASYLWPLVVASNSAAYPISVQVAGYFSIGAKYPTNVVMTAAFLSAIPIVIFYLAFNRLIVDGIARSGAIG
ncbi:MAG: carbohydrate ABC transporter permease [Devosia sp.]